MVWGGCLYYRSNFILDFLVKPRLHPTYVDHHINFNSSVGNRVFGLKDLGSRRAAAMWETNYGTDQNITACKFSGAE